MQNIPLDYKYVYQNPLDNEFRIIAEYLYLIVIFNQFCQEYVEAFMDFRTIMLFFGYIQVNFINS